ncbi:Fe-S cluster assembly ATPase SufC [Mycoplasmoides alvi]|uniref:Fe-S cluster assembly ATPase SufC n=1 Tax=Mycoplasmoides alvi TaxID=78580 RepID=UPI00051C24BE|nr:Fe-S cluster assembly ATPase SufC [Mycoplasmoides alvi]
MLLNINNLSVSIGNKKILTKINASIDEGDIVAIMGPNGHGKSTLLKAIMKHYSIKITRGSIKFKNQLISKLETDEIARLGLFLATQSPEEIPGVSNLDFLKAALNARSKKPVGLAEMFKKIQSNLNNLKMSPELLKRSVNEGFSGGEKKKNEILQLRVINPKCALLDEIDSGLDIDALKIITKELSTWIKEDSKRTLVIVSHYERLFKYLKPNKVFLIINGTIVKEGGYDLVNKIDREGYDWIKKDLKINFKHEITASEKDFILEDPLGKKYGK